MKKFSLCVKRIFDIVSSGICIIMLTPVWIGVSIAIKKDSDGPIDLNRALENQLNQIINMQNINEKAKSISEKYKREKYNG